MTGGEQVFKSLVNNYKFLIADAKWTAVAGGACRDLILEKPIRDVDLFVGVSDSAFELYKNGCIFLIEDYDDGTAELRLYPGSYYPAVKKGKMLARSGEEEYDNPEFCSYVFAALNFIFVKASTYSSPEALVSNHFTCHLSQVFLPVNPAYRMLAKELKWTSNFVRDWADNTITFNRYTNQKYIHKLCVKYPERQMVYEGYF